LTIFVDTSIWFAAANIREQRNGRAQTILSGQPEMLTTDHVIVECWLLLNSRLHREAAEQFWRGMRSGIAQIEKVTLADLETGWAIGQAFSDQKFSLVDRTSFAVMERLGISRVASFDDDFAIYRYGRNRDRAFEVLR
jgi:predicted nucleic acid-binding protein